MTHKTAASTLVPSRHGNPFATCWTKPGALVFRFTKGQTIEDLVKKLAAQNWWGEVIGPHGSGKSTLLETLKPALVAAGRNVKAIALRDGEHRLPRDFFSWEGEAPAEPQADIAIGSAGVSPSRTRNLLFVVDGYEQLGWLQRWGLKRHCRKARAGLLVTSHAPTGLPELIRLAPDRALVNQLVGDLCENFATGITPADIAASHACHGSNVREVLFELYDRHEARRRAARTAGGAEA